MLSDVRRGLPSVDAVLRHAVLGDVRAEFAPAVVAALVREVLGDVRRDAAGSGTSDLGLAMLAARVAAEAERRWRPEPRTVVNATGVILHTNLGRAPISTAAAAAGFKAATAYSDLEFDLDAGARGSRHTHLTALLQALTGAEDAVAVNNTAAALVLVLSALARRREVVVSRGQAVEIGGGFRIPTIMRESGARLVEVGTTNKTRLDDYAEATTEKTGGVLYVHSSNFRIVGFTSEVALADLADLTRERGVPLIADVGSGALRDLRAYGLAAEPVVGESVAAGADLVLFSGDKLLGGPQAGIIVGRADLIKRLRAHPLMRVLRLDKVAIAMLNATLLHYMRGEEERVVPVWTMIAARQEDLEARARRWCAALRPVEGIQMAVELCAATVGGGSLPGETLPSAALTLRAEHRPSAWASVAATRLRKGTTPVVARVERDRVLLDARTVLPTQDDLLLDAVEKAIEG